MTDEQFLRLMVRLTVVYPSAALIALMALMGALGG